MTAARRLALALLSGLYLAALAPCPTASAAHAHQAAEHGTHAEDSAMPCHEGEPSAALAARCPCGCGERTTAAPAGGRLGPALPSAAPAAATPLRPFAFAAIPLRVPDAPPRAIDRIPLTSSR